MKIAFIDNIPWDYVPTTPELKPLGGAQSTLCYLARHLAFQGHSVFLFNHTKRPDRYNGVYCQTIGENFKNELSTFDIIIVLTPEMGIYLKENLAEKFKAKLLLWTGHDSGQPAVAELKNKKNHNLFDYFIVKSNWQKEQYQEHFQIAQNKLHVFHNAIAPSFENLFTTETNLYAYKTTEISLAYTSTPFRGLEILISIFPLIKKIMPSITLKVFSSMEVYHVNTTEDPYTELYRKCTAIEGIDYVGSLTQPKLAQALKNITILSYPNTFPETCSTAIMEALASGCIVIASDLGALAETTYGFAHLIPVTKNWEEYALAFVEEIVTILKTINTPARTTQLKKQVQFMNENCTWKTKSKEWSQWLETIK